MLVCWHFGAKVRRCGDTFHPPEKLTLYLKVTPFDSNTPTHLNQKVPIGGMCVAAKLPNSPAFLIIKLNHLSLLYCLALYLALLFIVSVRRLPCSLAVLSFYRLKKTLHV